MTRALPTGASFHGILLNTLLDAGLGPCVSRGGASHMRSQLDVRLHVCHLARDETLQAVGLGNQPAQLLFIGGGGLWLDRIRHG